MKLLTLIAAFGLFLQTPITQADPHYWRFEKMKRDQASKQKTPPAKLIQGSFDQIIDHFEPLNENVPKFKQRYFIDSTFAKGPNAPVIYYLCGEGACEGASSTTEVNDEAKKIGAYRVALEHRYYGTSQPYATLEAGNLIYLSMDQAIEDLATFQKYLQETMKLKGKWISVGGSYAGELSAFYRLKHPELVVGALASSAPVLAKADFFEYDRHVARVAGPQCLNAMKKVVADVETKLQNSDSAAAVKSLFNSSQVKNDVDFLYVIADMGALAIQYGFQKGFCKSISDGVQNGNATEAYAAAGIKLMNDVFGMTPFEDSFQAAESIDPKDYASVGMRSWMYQSCTEFGFYQIANSVVAESSRSQQITLAYHNNVCNRLFGLTKAVDTAVTNQKFYNQLFNKAVTNIYFTNGSNDPWSNLSITKDSPHSTDNPGLKLFTIAGSAHCDDLGARVQTPAAVQARSQFASFASQWLSE